MKNIGMMALPTWQSVFFIVLNVTMTTRLTCVTRPFRGGSGPLTPVAVDIDAL